MVARNLNLGGRRYVIIEWEQYDQLRRASPMTKKTPPARMPDLPKPDSRGLRPASQTLRALLARDIIKDRVALGWSQRELARRAGIRPETLCRIESGQHTPTVATVERIDRALRMSGADTRN